MLREIYYNKTVFYLINQKHINAKEIKIIITFILQKTEYIMCINIYFCKN